MEVSEFINTNDVAEQETHDQEWEVACNSGGTSICYQCRHNGVMYFKKSLRHEYLADNRYRAAYRKEYCIGYILNNPYIVNYRRITDTDDECSLLMDYVDGRTLKNLMAEEPEYFANRTNLRRFVHQLLTALQYMHQRQILHMDLNPSNVMITTKTHDVKVIDLGFCYSDTYQDTAGTTRGFSASELHNGASDFDVRTDIYAFGKLLEFIRQHTPSGLPRMYKKIATKCMAQNKEDRYQTVDEIYDKITTRRRLSLSLLAIHAVIFAFICIAFLDVPRYAHRLIYGYDFADQRGLKYNVLSKDSLTCTTLGYDVSLDHRGSIDHGHVIIPVDVDYDGRLYTVAEVADSAFMCDSITTMLSILPKTLKVHERGFSHMKNLRYVTFAGDDVKLEFEAFAVSKKIILIDYPRNLKVIPANCFIYRELKKLDLPEGIEVIDQDAFVACDSLEEAVLPSTLKSLGRGVFYACKSLEEVHIPESVTNIGMFCFMECPSLKRIYNHATTPQTGGKLFNGDTRVTVYVPEESVEKYKRSDIWKDQDIRPMEKCNVHD